MDVLLILLPFVLAGIAVLFVAFSGGPKKARDAYISRGGRFFRLTMVLLYLGLGIGVPAAVIAGKEEARGGVGRLETTASSKQEEEGKQLFKRTCASCHNLDAVNARGVTGPDLDEIGTITKGRIINAIENGGTGQKRMPADLLQGADAEAVAVYVSKVAGK